MSGFFGGASIGPQAIGRSGAPPDPVPVAGADALTDGNMEAAGVTSWFAYGSPTTREKSNTQVQAGAQSLHIVADAVTQGAQNIVTVAAQTWYRADGYIYVASGGATANILNSALVNYGAVLSAASWMAITLISRSSSGLRIVLLSSAAAEFYSDSWTCVPLTLSTLISTRAYMSADCDLSAAITRTSGTQAGFVARLDSASSPANFLIAYIDSGNNVKVDKCVGGTYTNVISGAVTYGATKRLRLVCSGTSVSAYYDGTQVGSTVTVSDAGIVSNTRHGKFSTYASNTFSGYVAA